MHKRHKVDGVEVLGGLFGINTGRNDEVGRQQKGNNRPQCVGHNLIIFDKLVGGAPPFPESEGDRTACCWCNISEHSAESVGTSNYINVSQRKEKKVETADLKSTRSFLRAI